MWLALAMFGIPAAVLAAIGYYVLPFWAVLTGFVLFPTILLAVWADRDQTIGDFKKKIAAFEGKLQFSRSEQAKSSVTLKELGNAYEQVRAQLTQVQSQNIDLQNQLKTADSRSDALTREELVSAQLRQTISGLEGEKVAVERELVSVREAASATISEVMRLRPLEQRVRELEQQGIELRNRTRVAEDYARARENWLPFAISDEDFAGAVAKVFK